MLDKMFLVCFVSIGAVGVASWTALIRRKKRGQDLLGRLGGRELIGSPYGLIDVFLVFFAWFGGQFVAVGVAMLLLGVSLEEIPDLSGDEEANLLGIVGLAQLAAITLALVALYVRYCKVGRVGLQALGLQPHRIAKDVALGVLAFTMVIPIVLLIQWLLTLLVDYEHQSLKMLSKDAAPLTFVLVWFVAGIVAPICEEVFFRGTLQAWLQRLGPGRMKSDQILIGGWDEVSGDATKGSGPDQDGNRRADGAIESEPDVANPYRSPQFAGSPIENQKGEAIKNDGRRRSWATQAHWPVYVSAFIFAALHLGQGAAPIPLFVLAVVLGYLYRKTESILPCIVLHMLLNMFSLFWYTLNVIYGVEPML